MVHRRAFVKQLISAGLSVPLIPLLDGCNSEQYHYPVRLSSPDYKNGHQLRDGWKIAPVEIQRAGVVIIGGGVSGLSALRKLKQSGLEDVLLLEMDAETGGNALGGSSDGVTFPYGAHYLPVPDPEDSELIRFLEEAGVVTGQNEKGEYLFKEEYLSRSPHERLFYRGRWKDGLVPGDVSLQLEMQEVDRFFDLVEKYKVAKLPDGSRLFSLPMGEEVFSAEARQLDEQTFASFLDREGFKSPELRWYVDYCCRDDYGGNSDQISAYAGLHYFCSRRGHAGNADSDEVLTWEDGNYFLVRKLRSDFGSMIRTQSMVLKLEERDTSILLSVVNTSNGNVYGLEASKVIVACPAYVAGRILPDAVAANVWASKLRYAPWLVANVVLKKLPVEREGGDIAWDNVVYGSESLGYIHSTHQRLEVHPEKEVFTWYHAFSSGDWKATRKKLLTQTPDELWAQPLKELKLVYPDIEKNILSVDVHLWGHGMICPVPGLISSKERRNAQAPWKSKIYFAHTDRSGISLFEEAFHQGIKAANQLMSGE